jgi:uncharacterized membrane protein
MYYKNDAFTERSARGTRLETIVDASFAFAITMLIISLGTIPRTYTELIAALKGIPAFAGSFLLILNFWLGHYRFTRRYGIEDGWIVALSLALVFTVLVFLFPLKMMMFGAFGFFSGGFFPSPLSLGTLSQLNALFATYAVGFTAMSLTLAALFRYASRTTVEPPLSPLEQMFTRVEIQVWLVQAACGVLSLLIATLVPGRWAALAPWPYASLGIVLPIMGLRAKKRAEALAKDVTSAPPDTMSVAAPDTSGTIT